MQRVYRFMGPAVVVAMIMIWAGHAAAQPVSDHLMVGHWEVSTDGASAREPVREGIFTFGVDGSILVVFQSRPTGIGTVELIWWGEGAWEADGDNAVRYTVSWPTKDAEGVVTGTLTFDGVITIQDEGLTFAEDRSQSVVTVRNRNGIVVATYG
ncbi:MAG: hypothetical protein M3457_13210, partial [Chloroflexota bacterium]|nr:hypothetical protein [Chloroflexota bacterium]